MEAIAFKVGNGKGVERIAEAISDMKSYRITFSQFHKALKDKKTFTKDESTTLAAVTIGTSIRLERFLDDVKERVIDDGDVFDYINESGDTTFMDDVRKTINNANMTTVKYFLY